MTAFRLIGVVGIAALTVLGLLFVTGILSGDFLVAHSVKLAAILGVLIVAIFAFKGLAKSRGPSETEKPPIL